MPAILRTAADVAYRLGLGPRPSDTPDHRLVEVVDEAKSPGRALDLGCGTGRNARYLARRGWGATGVDMSGEALRVAAEKATADQLEVLFVRGDVTRLGELGIGDGYRLVMDGGCYHMVPPARRNAYADGVTRAAAPGALLIMVGFGRHLGLGIDPDELVTRFTGWDLIAADRVPGAHPLSVARVIRRPTGGVPRASRVRC